MDWTIVVSVLVALLLWPVVMASAVSLMILPVAAVFRGRLQRLKQQKMAQCKEMFNSSAAATAGDNPDALVPCPCAGASEPR